MIRAPKTSQSCKKRVSNIDVFFETLLGPTFPHVRLPQEIQKVAKMSNNLPIRLLLSDPYRSIDLVSDIRCPTLVLAASDDEIIPKENTLRLMKKFHSETATLQVIRETDHNSISNCTLYWSSVCHFKENSFGTP